MKFSTIACVGVFSVVSGYALASNMTGPVDQQQVPGTGPATNLIQIPDCAAGFNKSSVQGSPQSESYSWECKTPVIVCPAGPPGMSGGLQGPVAVASGKGEVFKYYCSWSIPPH